MINEIVKKQKEYFNTFETLNINFRIQTLKKLKNIILENEEKIKEALYLDLNKSVTESYMTEIGMALSEITHAIKNLKKWTKIKKVKTSLANFPSKSFIITEPYGVTLIISPWNYPFLLTIGPLINAISAGNTCIIKPSEYSINTSNVIKDLINDNFKEEYIKVILGGIEETTEILKQNFDLIFFTGSPKVGKIVMQAASINLTKVILELGGKSPVIVDDTVDLKIASKRITFGKFLNAGQTCVAPDYLLIKESVKDEFIKYLKEDTEKIANSTEYCKIINEKNYQRLISLVNENKIIYKKELNDLKLGPIILDNVTFDDEIMKEEIFGPILPIISYQNETELINTLKQTLDKTSYPLACYIFSNNKKLTKELLKLRFGGGCINDTINHLASTTLPFGGIGYSGMGAYHGKTGFDAFSHQKSILKKSIYLDITLRYYPYNKKKENIIKKFLK